MMGEQATYTKFRRALRKEDQDALDDLFRFARYHVAAAGYASHSLPFEVMLLAMLLEEHKMALRLHQELEHIKDMLRTMESRVGNL